MKTRLNELKKWASASMVMAIMTFSLATVFVQAGEAPLPTTELYLNEILFNDPNGSDSPNEYVEIRGVPSGGKIPAGTYLVGIEGDNHAGTMGMVNFVFDLSSIVLGTEGFLTIFMDSTPYTADAGSTTVTGTSGGNFTGAAGYMGGLPHIEETSTTFFLIEAPVAPITSDGIDSSDGGIDGDGIPTGALYDSWTILDSVSIVDNVTSASPDTTNGGHSPSLIFATDPDAADFLANPGATIIDLDGILPHYIARIGNSTGSSENDWVVGELSGTAPSFTLAVGGTFPDSLEGYALDHIGAPNFLVRPDNQIGEKLTKLKGGNIYNSSGTGQKVVIVTDKRKTLKYFFKIENDGAVDDSATVKGKKGNKKFSAKYIVDGEGNMTGAITAGTYQVDLGAGEMKTGKVIVKPTAKTEKTSRKDLKKKKRTFTLDIDSKIDKSETDRNKFISKTK